MIASMAASQKQDSPVECLATAAYLSRVIRASARATADHSDHVVLLELSGSLGGGNGAQGVVVVACPGVSAISGEIVRCHVNIDDFETFGSPLIKLTRSELEPFIIGAGRV